MKRTENGSTVETANHAFVAADLVAKLAGVSLGTVAKVIAAQDVVGEVFDLDDWELLDFASVPLALPDEDRASMTNTAYAHIVSVCRDDAEAFSQDQRERLKL